jgi:hypothetical protein
VLLEVLFGDKLNYLAVYIISGKRWVVNLKKGCIMKKSYQVSFDRSGECECPFDMPTKERMQDVVHISTKECTACEHWLNTNWDRRIVECSHPDVKEDVTTIKYSKQYSEKINKW